MAMRALIGCVGSNWMLREQEIPLVTHGAVRVRVVAAGLNRADLLMLEGKYGLNSKINDLYGAGMELAGIVETSSPLAPHLPVGTRVMGVTKGAFAEYALCHPGTLMPIPDNVSFVEAAALPAGLATEHDALVRLGGFKPGNSVLIVGGTSAVGQIGIQLAKALGAGKVIATTTNDSKRPTLIEAGADLTVNTSLKDLVSVVRDATDGKGVDITLDHLGGELFAKLPNATRIGGIIVNIGRLAGVVAELNLDEVSFRRLRVIGTTFSVRTADELAAVNAALVPQVLPAVGAGLIKARIDRTYPIESFSDAAERMRGGAGAGKIVFVFDALRATSCS